MNSDIKIFYSFSSLTNKESYNSRGFRIFPSYKKDIFVEVSLNKDGTESLCGEISIEEIKQSYNIQINEEE